LPLPPGLFHSSLERSPPLEPVKPSVAVKYWDIIADNLSKAGEKQTVKHEIPEK
jgi:hypothetical protein